MKKIRTLYVRDPKNPKLVTDQLAEGGEIVFTDRAVPTWKLDGSAMMTRCGKLFKRREVKVGQATPADFEEVDRVEGKVLGWVPVGDGPEDKWYVQALTNVYDGENELNGEDIPDGTWEAVGPHFQGNPHGKPYDMIVRHGEEVPPFAFIAREDLRAVLENCDYEGIVWHVDGEPAFKIKRKDFGLPWPIPKTPC